MKYLLIISVFWTVGFAQRWWPKVQRIGVQNARFAEGQLFSGVERGPDLIRSSGVIEYLQDTLFHDIVDYGDINLNMSSRELTPIRNPDEVARANRLIYESTRQIALEGRVVLTLGGDHSVSIGTIAGLAEIHPNLAVLWVDAHPDINTPATTGTGNMHGMPLAFVVQELKNEVSNMTQFSWIRRKIPAKNLGYIGLGWTNEGMRDTISNLRIPHYTVRDVDRIGILEVTRRALRRIMGPGRTRKPLHVSFDIDVLDDVEIGSNTGTPVEGGLTLREAMTLLEEVQRTANVVSMDFVEVNPALGDTNANNRTAAVARKLISCMFGSCRGGF